MTRAIPTILLSFLTAAALLAQDDKPAEIRRHDVRSLMSALAETSMRFPFTTSPVRTGGAGESAVRSLWGLRGEEMRQDDAIQEIVRFALRCDAEPDDCRERLFATDGWLQVSGPARFHDQVPRVLTDLRRALATIEVELSVLPREALASLSSAILDPAKADRLLQLAKPLATLRTHVRPGSQTLLEAVARRAYVKDYDTEVAQDSKVVDPIVDVIPEGIRATIRVDPTPGGAYVVTIEGQAAELAGPMRTQVLTYSSPANLQLPRIWWSSTSSSARLENRGALVLGNDAAPRSAWMIRVLGPESPKTPDGPSVQLLPLRAVTRAALRTRAPEFHSPNPGGMETHPEGEPQDESAPRLDAERLLERVRALSPDLAAEERRALSVGGFVALDGNRAFLSAARELVTKAVDDATRALSIELRVGTVPAAGFVLPAADQLETMAGALAHRAFGAAIPGDRIVLLGGESHAYLKDRDIEIAQGSSISDPMVDTFFTGFAASCGAVPAGDGRCAIEVRLEYQELLEMSTIATGSPEVPEIELPRIAAAVAEMSTEISLGSWALVHSSPLEGTDKNLVVLIRISPS